MISSVSNSFNWYPSLLQSSSPNSTDPTNLFGISSVDNYVNKNAIEQSLNLTNQPNTTNNYLYDILNNTADIPSYLGITNLNQYAQDNYLSSINPTISQINQASQAYNLNQNYSNNMYSLASLYDQTI